MIWHLNRKAAGDEWAHPAARSNRSLRPRDFPAEVPDPAQAAEIVIQRLNDAGFEIKAAQDS
jgi:hypothetical protein